MRAPTPEQLQAATFGNVCEAFDLTLPAFRHEFHHLGTSFDSASNSVSMSLRRNILVDSITGIAELVCCDFTPTLLQRLARRIRLAIWRRTVLASPSRLETRILTRIARWAAAYTGHREPEVLVEVAIDDTALTTRIPVTMLPLIGHFTLRAGSTLRFTFYAVNHLHCDVSLLLSARGEP